MRVGWRRGIGRAALATLLAASGLFAQSPPHAPSPSALEGQRVLLIRVVTEAGELLEENPGQLACQPGQPYSSLTVRESLRQLYRSGRYADIRAEVSNPGDGLRLSFVVRPNLFVNVVRVVGLEEPPSEPAALAAMRLGLGQAFRETRLRESVDQLRQALEEEGFYQSRIEPEFSPHADTSQVDITVHVTPGPRARVGAIEVHNLTGFPDSVLLQRSKLRTGEVVTSARFDRASERARKLLVGKGHLGARVAVRRGAYDPQHKTLPLVLEVSAGPRVRVEVTGAKIPRRDLRRLLPIYQEGAVDEDLLQEGRRTLRDFLEADGYFDSQVRYSVGTDTQTGHQVITYEVQRGPQRRLVGAAFEGNRYFSDELLRGTLRIQPAAFLARGRFSRRLLREDEGALRELYLANGFRSVEVQGELVENYAGKEGDLFVRFLVQEGPQTRVAELRLEGPGALSEEFLLAVVGSTPGQPYSEFNVAGDRDNLLAVYYNEGFPEARFEAVAAEAEEPNRVRLTYRITEGPQVRVSRLLLAGYEHTRPGVIAREVQVTPGEPLREGKLVETQRRLYNLGIFSRVTIAPQNPEGEERDKTLVVQVEEAKRYTIAYGGGIEVQRLGGAGSDPVGGEVRASPRGLFEISRANFAGRAHTVAFKARASSLQSRALVSYAAPHLFARPQFSLLLIGLADRTRDVRTFTSTRYEGSAQLAHSVSPVTAFLYRYSFRQVLVDPTSLRVDPLQIPLFSQPTKISALGFTWIRERRDNPADATRGDFNTFDLSLAAKSFGSSASFLRLFIQNSSFHPFGRHFVFARSARLGIQEPLGDTLTDEIPLPERFFAGGGNSLRGFGLNQAGPRDPTTGFPRGGLAMLLFNQELRFPMRLPFLGERLGGALFYDAGNVFSRANRITLRTSPPAPVFSVLNPQMCVRNCTNELSYLSHTIGFGLRYGTPIGPVRLDLGYQLNPVRFLVPNDTGGQRLARLPRFQFFFNIGSIF